MKKKNSKFHLEDLNIEMRTEVELSDGLILPLFFRALTLTQDDINLALSYFAEDKRHIEKDDITVDFKKIIYSGEEVIISNELKTQSELNKINELKHISKVFKFIDLEVLNMTTPKIRQFKNIEQLYEYLLTIGFDIMHFEIVFKTVAQYIVLMFDKIKKIIRDLFRTGNDYKDEVTYNMPMMILQGCYEDMKIPYFKYNIGKPMSEWSYIERECLMCYKTKKTMIDNAIRESVESKGGKK